MPEKLRLIRTTHDTVPTTIDGFNNEMLVVTGGSLIDLLDPDIKLDEIDSKYRDAGYTHCLKGRRRVKRRLAIEEAYYVRTSYSKGSYEPPGVVARYWIQKDTKTGGITGSGQMRVPDFKGKIRFTQPPILVMVKSVLAELRE